MCSVLACEVIQRKKKLRTYCIQSTENYRQPFPCTQDPVPTELQSVIIYKIKYNDCVKCYVGQTRIYLKKIMSEHRRQSTRTTGLNITLLGKPHDTD